MKLQRGFTLTELAVVFTIVALLLGGLMYTLSAQMQQRDLDTTAHRLEEAREALLGFVVVNGRLPCPAAAPEYAPFFGVANTAAIESPAGGGPCDDGYTGFLPGRTLGFQPVDNNGYALDSWGNPIRYAVSKDSTVGGFGIDWNFTTAGSIRTNGIAVMPQDLLVCTESAGITPGAQGVSPGPSCGAARQVTNQTVVVAVVWSQGKNFRDVAAGGADEAANNKRRHPAVANDHAIFVSHPPTQPNSPAGEFDDLVVWLPIGVLYGRMIAAGQLP